MGLTRWSPISGRMFWTSGVVPGCPRVVYTSSSRTPHPTQALAPHAPGPRARVLPSVCSPPQPQPQPQGPQGRRRPGNCTDPARTLSSPKGRAHGLDAGCSSGREGAAARMPATAVHRTRGTQRSSGSISAAEAEAAADTCGYERQLSARATTLRHCAP